MNNLKEVLHVYKPGSSHWVGNGFPVRNLIPSSGLEEAIDPFLLLDYAGPAQFEAESKPRGVGEHPHRGFETITLAYQGSVEHRDSAGNAGIIGPGDVQWMTAGSGVVHEEMHERNFARTGGNFEMIQLWLNLPAKHKMTAPAYQTITEADIPRLEFSAGNYARIIAGTVEGLTGPARSFTEVSMIDLSLEDGTAQFQIPSGQNIVVFLLNGAVSLNNFSLEGEAQLALLDKKGAGFSIRAQKPSRLLVLGGEPIGEPVASYGPFVMNTQEEIVQAVKDYQNGRMGHLALSI